MLSLFSGVSTWVGAAVVAVSGSPVGALAVGIAGGAAALGLYVAAVRLLERRQVTELAREDALRNLSKGVCGGLVLFTLTIGLIAVLGGYRITGWGSGGAAIAAFGVMFGVAVSEELLFRGVLFRIVEERAGTWGSLVVSALLFGGLHLANPNATVWGAVAIAVEAGALLAAAYVATRTLWLPIGLHLGWNWAEAGLFGTAVSGSGKTGPGLLDSVLSGPTALTGGAFGPEGSVLAVLICGLAAAGFMVLARRRGLVRPRRTARS
ncbi:Putative metal-dependent membrane protease, Abortive infection protein [Modestobacter italicus]|uniref:Metal-dependent membrane protease, Abortive infection protein n=1 Tax=Modestobacter italicus (strain DSM 44449 / CECT 9708 / BC 501) TaxID=2732864 RepID=I4F0J8_MODI5|nr:CPBP family intramembrane glutamic endopeptidase [Modestobacter marinus]CCH89161.1 Putative metal-dependent membrane protease, Abortive infection protein [Modestobacter marinus]